MSPESAIGVRAAGRRQTPAAEALPIGDLQMPPTLSRMSSPSPDISRATIDPRAR